MGIAAVVIIVILLHASWWWALIGVAIAGFEILLVWQPLDERLGDYEQRIGYIERRLEMLIEALGKRTADKRPAETGKG